MLVRHGQTDENIEPARVQGQRDVPLNERGRAQARELAERLRGCAQLAVALYSSPLSRARETADVIAVALGLEVHADGRLAESFRGRWEGHTWEQIRRADPRAYEDWRQPAPGFRFPGGESLEEHDRRVGEALDAIAAGPRPALVVCHGGTIRLALCRARGLGIEHFHDWRVPNAAVIPL